MLRAFRGEISVGVVAEIIVAVGRLEYRLEAGGGGEGFLLGFAFGGGVGIEAEYELAREKVGEDGLERC